MTNHRVRNARPGTARALLSLITCACAVISLFFQPGAGAALSAFTSAPAAHASFTALTPELQLAMSNATADARLRVIVRLKTSAPLSPFTTAPARTPQARAVFVSSLQTVATASQRSLNQFFADPAIAAQVDSVRPFWIFNGMALGATPQVISAIAARDDVATVALDVWRKWIDTPSGTPGPGVTAPMSRTLNTINDVVTQTTGLPWGIAKIGADRVWAELGITGTGVTVATIDSGVDWQHPALHANYRGTRGGLPADHLHNWFDGTDEGAVYPSDLNGHGTHTMGTLAGQDGIGVAPGARWMAAKGLNSQGYGLNSWLHAAFQFMLAPGGDPNYSPDLVSNSWGNNDGSSTEFSADIDALHAAGILVLFANGNSGPQDGSVGSPASLPNAFGIGATDTDDDVASFSSRGPSPFGDVRPHVSAPGVQVLSSLPGGVFGTESGTSMATPHVAGVAALLLSANPSLGITGTLYALTSTATALGQILPSNNSGWGRVDAYRAVLSVMSTGVIKGRVLEGQLPISNSLVLAGNGVLMASAISAADGNYSIPVVPGIYTATASAFGYSSAATGPRLVTAGAVTTVDFNLARLPYGVVSGAVYDAITSNPLTMTVVSALGTPQTSQPNLGTPPVYFISLPTGIYTIEARLLGYIVQTRTVHINPGQALNLNFTLTPTQRIAFVDSGAWYYSSFATQYRAALNSLSLPFDEYRVKHLPEDTPTITQLLKYDTVIWSSPYDSPAYISAHNTLTSYLTAGHNLMLSGQDVAYYDGGGFLPAFPYFTKINAEYEYDNASSRLVIGAPQTLLAGRAYTISGGDGANNQVQPDGVRVRNPDHGQLLAQYSVHQTGRDGAGVYSQDCQNFRSAFLSFGFEAINNSADRTDLMRRVLDAFVAPKPAAGIELLLRDQFNTLVAIGLPGQTVTHQVRLRNTGASPLTDTLSLSLSGNAWHTSLGASQVALASCATSMITLSVTIPVTVARNASDVVTLTAASAISPGVTTAITLTSKTPAGILVVDNDRFFDSEQAYLDALKASGNLADTWDTQWRFGAARTPPTTTLMAYPTVIWFDAYNWYDPVSLDMESDLQQYLDGGGRLFLTSQTTLYRTGLGNFNRNYLGLSSIDFNDITSWIAGAPGNTIGDGFASGSMLPFPYNWNLSAAVQPLSGTQVILRGSSGQPFGLARETRTAPWRTVLMPFAFETLTTTVRANLVNRVVGWLSWLGHSSLAPDRTSVSAGDAVTYTLQLRADDMIPPALHDPARQVP